MAPLTKSTLIIVVVSILNWGLLYPVLAIECAAATGALDKAICTNPELRNADGAMSAAYSEVLNSLQDRDMRDGLIASQRRWLRQRARLFLEDPSTAKPRVAEKDSDDEPHHEPIDLLRVTKDRHEWLQRKDATKKVFTIISVMQTQKTLLSKTSGGHFQGFRTDCFITPEHFGDGDYVCVGSRSFQNGARVCGVFTEWASHHETSYKFVGQTSLGSLQVLSSCRIGYAGDTCPTWAKGLDGQTELPTGSTLKLDPEGEDDAGFGDSWLDDCLNRSNYPP